MEPLFQVTCMQICILAAQNAHRMLEQTPHEQPAAACHSNKRPCLRQGCLARTLQATRLHACAGVIGMSADWKVIDLGVACSLQEKPLRIWRQKHSGCRLPRGHIRDPPRYKPCGDGKRICAGMGLAEAEIKVCTSSMAQHCCDCVLNVVLM